MIYDKYCHKLNCKKYIEWEYDDVDSDQPCMGISCLAQGQSSNIFEIADECPYAEVLQKIKNA